jgi:TPP-dependent pyruvate/acetoin dehydrogenase alpha subunit
VHSRDDPQLISSRDYMVTTYRGIHDQVAKGVPLQGLFAEALGRIDGLNKGKGGSPHISDPSSGSMLTTAIVGAGAGNVYPIGTEIGEIV